LCNLKGQSARQVIVLLIGAYLLPLAAKQTYAQHLQLITP